MLRQLERDLFPWIGERPIAEIHAMELLAALHKVEERGALETADRALMLARQVWDYWLPTADVQQRNITEGLKARLDIAQAPCNFGGTRQGFCCTRCARRVAVLYLFGGRFACRHWQRLAYSS